MVLGMSVATFTLLHVIVSLVALLAGFVVIYGFVSGREFKAWITSFLVTMVLTDITGFLLPAPHLLPSHVVGIASLLALGVAILSRGAGAASTRFVISVVVAQYFDAFVTVAQSFLKIPSLHALAPKGSEPPFLISQVVLLVLFVILGRAAVKGAHKSSGLRAVGAGA